MKTILEKIDYWIFQEYAPITRGLPLYRVFFACVLILFFLPASSEVALLPRSFFLPQPGLAWFFTGFPPLCFFWGLDYLLELAAFCLLFGYRTRLVSLLMVALFIIGNSFRNATGKISHDILIIATLFCLAWSDWGSRYSSDAQRLPARSPSTQPAWPQTLLMLVIGLCMLSAALPKAKSGWLNPHEEACRGQLVLNYVGADRPTFLADQMLSITSPFFWKSIDFSTVALEGAFIVAMFRLPAMRLVATLATLFHVLIFYSMDIFFYANLAAYACLFDFRIFLRNTHLRFAFRKFQYLARHIRLLPLALLVALIYVVCIATSYVEWRQAPAVTSLLAVITLIFGLSCLVSLCLQKLNLLLGKGPAIRIPAPQIKP